MSRSPGLTQNRLFFVSFLENAPLSHHFGEEKGVDVRLALDVIRLANQQAYDVGVIFNQDLTEVADEIRSIARMQARWIKLASAFPDAPTRRNRRGIDRTDWIRIDQPT